MSLGLTRAHHSNHELKTELFISLWASLRCSWRKALWASWRLIYLNKTSLKWQDNISHFKDRQQRHTGNSQCWATQDSGHGFLSRFVIICTFRHNTHSLQLQLLLLSVSSSQPSGSWGGHSEMRSTPWLTICETSDVRDCAASLRNSSSQRQARLLQART